ncbi:MAG: Fe-S cluster assembly scaffold protein NifU [Deferribacteraceae bacterium]|jgi:nitrogen fixation NifU-like protein|nr:Fe-S cluster assembly scaffold protein NifU [Deferribacteraceae bacterium]
MASGPYSDKVMDHFMNPRNMGEIPDANAVGEVGNPACGDVMRLYMKINDNDIIEDVKFKTFGCGAAIASSSMATELLKGKKLDEAITLTNQAIVDALDGLPPAKIHCSVMAEQGVEAALLDFAKRIGRDPSFIEKMKADNKTDKNNTK